VSVKRRDGAWQVDFCHQGKRVRKGFTTEPEALAWEADTKARLEKGISLQAILEGSTSASGVTLRSVFDSVKAKYWAGSKNETNAVRNAEAVLAALGGTRHPAEITDDDVMRMVARFKTQDKNSDATINRKLAALSRMMRYAHQRGYLPRPLQLEMKREDNGRIRYYSTEEEAKILAAIKDQDFRDLVVFLVDTGCRLGEALACRPTDCNDIYVRFYATKNDQPRSVPMTSRVREIVARRSQGSPALFWPGVDSSRAGHVWNEVREAVGLKDDPQAVLHTFRHTCASRLIQRGVPITTIQQWLGHKTLTMTLRYAHLAPSNLLQAVSALEESAPSSKGAKTG